MSRTTIACALALAAAGCGAIRPAQMTLPEGLAARTAEAKIEGLGAGRSGTLQVAGNSGPFTRAASQLTLFDAASFDRGGSTFTVAGADFPSPVSARCRFRQNTVTLGIVDFAPKQFAYECDFDGLPGARLSLQEAARVPRTLQAERRGQISISGKLLTLRSVHEIEGSMVPVAAPIGYVFESGGQAIAAIELNGTVPQLRLPETTQPEQRRSALLAAIAVSLLWDPAAR